MTTNPATAADSIRALDFSFDEATLRGDAVTLTRILAEDFVYTHGTGRRDTKQSWIARYQDPANRHAARTLTDYEVEVHGDIALAIGRLDITEKSGVQLGRKFARVHKLTPEGWKLVNHTPVQLF